MPQMWTSISAFEDAFGKDGKGGCMRRWWFNKVVKMPKKPRQATVFGDVFHAVLARFYSADDRGLINGKPVDLYPDGWKTMIPRFGNGEIQDDVPLTINDSEEALIKVLIEKAKSDGILFRAPGRVVEREITSILYTESGINPFSIVLKGFIDLETQKTVEDHKTAKSTEWIVSCNKLKTNAQMLAYAWDKYQRGHSGDLWLVHNNYIKDFNSPAVIRREIVVDLNYVTAMFMQELLPRFKRMLDVFKRYPAETVEKWRDIPPPNDPNKECNHHFGGDCPFISICSGQRTISQYRKLYEKTIPLNSVERKDDMTLLERIKAANAAVTPPVITPPAVTTPAQPETKPAEMPANLAAILAKVKSQTTAQQPATSVQPPAAQTPPPPPTTPVVPEKQKAPWYQPGCTACKDNDILGFNSQGGSCMICDAVAASKGLPNSKDYNVDVVDNNITYTLKNAENPAPATAPASATSPAVETPISAVKRPRSKRQDRTSVPEVPAPTNPMESIPTGTGQTAEPAGFFLFIGCVPMKLNGGVATADDILRNLLNEIASAAGKKLVEIEHFALMQAIDACIADLAARLKGYWVVTVPPTKGTALARLVDGLRQYAENVIVATAV